MWQKTCKTCDLYIPQQKTCQIMGQMMMGKMEPTDHCSKHNDHIAVCEICGGGLLEPIIEMVGTEVHIYCANCYPMER